jgi:glucose-6-phosphate 1-dehydrogenase
MLAADMDERQCLLVIFGASGDLTRRKLIPGLFELHVAGLLSSHVGVLGISRTPLSDDQFRERMKSACRERRGFDEERWREFAGRMHYLAADAMHAEEWPRITGALCQVQTAHSTGGEILFYLSVAPELYERIIQNIGAAGLNQGIRRWCSAETNPAARRRIIVEKPLGRDLQSAEHLNRVLGRVFDDEDVFRIDHYLGKETVQNLLVFRFANLLFEPLWNRMYIDHVQITAAETVGVGNRAAYYDSAGAMRDMIQSHLLQLMAVVAMEPPNSFRASDLRSEQRHVLEAVRPIAPDEVARLAVRAQYARAQVDGAVVPGYCEEPGVPPDSACDTFAALKLFIDNWRWEGVPFFLRTGKRMRRKLTQFVINFKPAPHLFRNVDGDEIRPRPNRLVVNVQPDEGISLRFEGKVPGLGLHIQSAVLDFDYRQQFSAEPFEAYATLLLEAIRGNQSHYKDRHEIEAAWRIVMPVLDAWRDHPGEDLVPYPAGSWGPAAADELIKPHGPWRNPETTVSRAEPAAASDFDLPP